MAKELAVLAACEELIRELKRIGCEEAGCLYLEWEPIGYKMVCRGEAADAAEKLLMEKPTCIFNPLSV